MKAYLIDPTTKTVGEVDYDGDYKKIARLIGAASGLFTTVSLPDDNVAYVDDEGLLVNPNPNGYFSLLGFGQTFAGKALIVGTNEEGDDTDVSLPLRMIQLVTRFIDNPTPESIEPRSEVMSLEDAAARGLLPPGLEALLDDDGSDGQFVPLEDQILPPRD